MIGTGTEAGMRKEDTLEKVGTENEIEGTFVKASVGGMKEVKEVSVEEGKDTSTEKSSV